MNRRTLLLSLLLGLAASAAWAGGLKKECCGVSIPGCCDDYCRKPMPCVPCPPTCGTCDDYCRKPLPCPPCLPCAAACDDYCRKPMPRTCWPAPGNLKCVPYGDAPCSRPAPCAPRR